MSVVTTAGFDGDPQKRNESFPEDGWWSIWITSITWRRRSVESHLILGSDSKGGRQQLGWRCILVTRSWSWHGWRGTWVRWRWSCVTWFRSRWRTHGRCCCHFRNWCREIEFCFPGKRNDWKIPNNAFVFSLNRKSILLTNSTNIIVVFSGRSRDGRCFSHGWTIRWGGSSVSTGSRAGLWSVWYVMTGIYNRRNLSVGWHNMLRVICVCVWSICWSLRSVLYQDIFVLFYEWQCLLIEDGVRMEITRTILRWWLNCIDIRGDIWWRHHDCVLPSWSLISFGRLPDWKQERDFGFGRWWSFGVWIVRWRFARWFIKCISCWKNCSSGNSCVGFSDRRWRRCYSFRLNDLGFVMNREVDSWFWRTSFVGLWSQDDWDSLFIWIEGRKVLGNWKKNIQENYKNWRRTWTSWLLTESLFKLSDEKGRNFWLSLQTKSCQ